MCLGSFLWGNCYLRSVLWKVFGERPREALKPEHAGKSREELIKETGMVVALRDVSFEVRRGETFVVMGLSGSGKSTLARCLIRLLEPTAGDVLVDGENILEYSENQLKEFRRRKTGMVFQHFGLLPTAMCSTTLPWGSRWRGSGSRTATPAPMRCWSW